MAGTIHESISKTALLDELTEQNYMKFLKSNEVSCIDVLDSAIKEAYLLGFHAGQASSAKENNNEENPISHSQMPLQY